MDIANIVCVHCAAFIYNDSSHFLAKELDTVVVFSRNSSYFAVTQANLETSSWSGPKARTANTVKSYFVRLNINSNLTVHGKKSFLSTDSDTKILHSIYFAYKVGSTSSYSNKINSNL